MLYIAITVPAERAVELIDLYNCVEEYAKNIYIFRERTRSRLFRPKPEYTGYVSLSTLLDNDCWEMIKSCVNEIFPDAVARGYDASVELEYQAL